MNSSFQDFVSTSVVIKYYKIKIAWSLLYRYIHKNTFLTASIQVEESCHSSAINQSLIAIYQSLIGQVGMKS